jgi:hypothetical protein
MNRATEPSAQVNGLSRNRNKVPASIARYSASKHSNGARRGMGRCRATIISGVVKYLQPSKWRLQPYVPCYAMAGWGVCMRRLYMLSKNSGICDVLCPPSPELQQPGGHQHCG